jgi:hypothetical protein
VGGTQLVRAAAAAQQRVNKFEFVTPDNRLQEKEKEKKRKREKRIWNFIIDCNVKGDRTCLAFPENSLLDFLETTTDDDNVSHKI